MNPGGLHHLEIPPVALGGITLIPKSLNVHDIHILRAPVGVGPEDILSTDHQYEQLGRGRHTGRPAVPPPRPRSFTARHPLDRLVSAYRDKFNDGARCLLPKRLKELQRRGERGNVSFTFTEFLTHV
ncbi:hypothetical protein GWK47_037893 [Chionoecetes opilio]|uniref:Uncharacterized protein n=1 Tax=Chionoecetes opilio TaxID=41210 RepID=A0A8J4YD77_CHIOP|nr:hypothetical protein GWK47_037893 [Chionoecetes opilio]